MNRFALISIALLVLGLGWMWMDSPEPSVRMESPAPAETEVANESRNEKTEEAPEPAVDEQIALKRAELGTEGPTPENAWQGTLTLRARQAEFYAAPPSASVTLDAWLQQAWRDEDKVLHHNRYHLGTLTTDAEGKASMAYLVLPRDGEEQPDGGRIVLTTQTEGWQIPIEYSLYPGMNLYGKKRDDTDADVIIAPGASILVEVVGAKDRRTRRITNAWVQVWDLDREQMVFQSHITQARSLGSGKEGIVFPLTRKGRYRFLAQGPSGNGQIESVDLDPADGNQRLTLQTSPHLGLSGRFPHAEEYTVSGARILAVQVQDSQTEFPAYWARTEFTSPATTAEAVVDEHGAFSLHGLAPGKYRLGYCLYVFDFNMSFETDSLLQGKDRWPRVWLNTAPVEAGTEGLELELPYAFLDVRVTDHEGKTWDKNDRKRPYPTVSRSPEFPDGWPETIHALKTADAINRFAILPGKQHRLQIDRYGFESVAMDIPPMQTGEVRTLEIELERVEYGTLTWDALEDEMEVIIRTADGSRRVEDWSSQYSRGPSALLRPGTYQVIVKGRTRTGYHGGIGLARTELGSHVQMVEIVAGQTEHLEYELPPVGSLKIVITADGQPDYQTYPLGIHGAVDREAFQGQPYHRNRANLVMRSKSDLTPVALSYQEYAGGSAYDEVYEIQPGITKVPRQVFAPGAYELEVRIPGFPRQVLDVEIFGKQQTLVEIQLQGK
ncbi:MAG: hypothetical protein ACPG31_09865 [Planctomycetota bacterium]